MFMSALWDTIFMLNDTYRDVSVFLIDNHIPALRFGDTGKPVVFAAGFGADEWQSSVMLLTFFEDLLRHAESGKTLSGIAVRKAFKKRSVIAVPCVCPPKMKYEGEALNPADLSAFAKYLSFHPAQMLVCVQDETGSVFSAKANEKLPADSDTVAKILCACSKLDLLEQADSVGTRFCEWTSAHAALPSYVISPPAKDIAALPYTYKRLEETFTVSALL